MEIDFLNFIQNNLRCDVLDFIMLFFSKIGDRGILWIVLGFLMLIFKKTRKCGILLLIAITSGYLIGEVVLKNIFCRPRPFTSALELLKNSILSPLPKSYSFPSGHTTSSFAAAFIVFKHNYKAGTAAYITAALIAFSRMYLYVHYPSDILAGILLGTLCAYLTYRILNKRFKKSETE